MKGGSKKKNIVDREPPRNFVYKKHNTTNAIRRAADVQNPPQQDSVVIYLSELTSNSPCTTLSGRRKGGGGCSISTGRPWLSEYLQILVNATFFCFLYTVPPTAGWARLGSSQETRPDNSPIKCRGVNLLSAVEIGPNQPRLGRPHRNIALWWWSLGDSPTARPPSLPKQFLSHTS